MRRTCRAAVLRVGLLVGLGLGLAAAGCVESGSVPCGTGLICPVGSSCDEANQRCVTDDQVAACAGLADGDLCAVADAAGTCDLGVCVIIQCGNSIVEPGELCDDGNLESGDGCRGDCRSDESCGNGVLDFLAAVPEECDCGADPDAPAPGCLAANADDGGPCRTDCQLHCGDGEVRGDELCDGGVPGGLSCFSFGFDYGPLTCHDTACALDFAGCHQIGWQLVASTTRALRGIWASGPDDVFAVGLAGIILHYDGATWIAMDSGVTAALDAVWGAAPDDVWAVGGLDAAGLGTIVHYDGTGWTRVTSPLNRALHAISGTGATDLVAVGDGGLVLRYDGAWAVAQDTGPDLTGVHATDGRVVAVGGTQVGEIDGAVVTYTSLPGSVDLRSVVGTGPDDLVLVGATVWRWDGDWVQQPVAAGEPLLGGVVDSAASITLVGRRGRTTAFDGLGWGDLLPGRAFGATDASLVAATRAGDELYAVSNVGDVFRFAGNGFAPPAEVAAGGIAAMWGMSDDTLVVAIGPGRVLHFDGSDFAEEALGVAPYALGFWGTAADDLYAVAGSQVLHYDGAWSTVFVDPEGDVLLDLWGSGAGDIVAVGEAGTILEFDGRGWTQTTWPGGLTLGAVWGSGPDDVYAVGGASGVGLVVHREAGAWSAVAGFADVLVFDVGGTGPGDVFVLPFGAEPQHFDGAAWTAVATGATDFLFAIAGGPLGTFIVGDQGTLLRFEAGTWSPVHIPADEQRLLEVTVRDRDVWLADDVGQLYRWRFFD